MLIRRMVLSKFPNCSVIEASNGDEALNVAVPAAPDLITIDINMPGMSSFDAARLLREKYPSAKMAVITANIQNTVRQKIQSLGILFLAVIEKPLTENNMQKIFDAC